MSTGAIMEAAREIIESGEVPDKVSARLQVAIGIENANGIAGIHTRLDKIEKEGVKQDDFDELEERVDAQEKSTRRWSSAAVFIASVITAAGQWWKNNN